MKIRQSYGWRSLLASTILSPMVASPAIAAADVVPPSSSSEKAADAPQDQIEDIVVTARRTAESQQSVPVSITALGETQLRDQNVFRVQDVQRLTPGFQATTSNRGDNSPTYSIRGQAGTYTQTALNDSPVSVYLADFNLSRGVGTNSALFDLESVQVLKGPQGTLFGRNSTGGAVLIQPRLPTSDFEGYAQVSAGNYNYRDFEGVLNIPVGDKVALRLGGKIGKRDGYLTNVVLGQKLNDMDSKAFRVSLRLRPTDNIDSTFMGNYFLSETAGQGVKVRNIESYALPNLPGDPAGVFLTPAQRFRTALYNAELAELNAAKALGKYELRSGLRGAYYDRARSIQNNTTIELGDFTIKNVIGYRDIRDKYTTNGGGMALDLARTDKSLQRGKSWSEEFQVQFKTDNLELIAGLYYFREKGRDQFNSIGNAYLSSPEFLAQVAAIDPTMVATYKARFPVASFLDFEAVNSSKAAFAHANYKLDGLANGLSISAGIRYTQDNREVTYHSEALSGLVPAIAFCIDTSKVLPPTIDPVACSSTYKISSKEPTYDIGLNYQPNADLLIYAVHRHAYRSGGFNNVPPNAQLRSFTPEKVDDYEIGLKSDFNLGDMPVRLNLAAYTGDYNNIQKQVTTITSQGTISTATINAAKARISGLEAEFTVKPATWASFTISYAYIRPKYKKYEDILVHVPATATTPAVFEVIDLSDAKFQAIPSHQLNANAVFTAPLDGDSSLRFALSYYYQSSVAVGEPGTRNCGSRPTTNPYKSCFNYLATLPGYGLFNLTIDWKNVANKGFDLSLFADNLFDKFYIPAAASSGTSTGTGYGYSNIGAPRMVGARLRIPFGASAE